MTSEGKNEKLTDIPGQVTILEPEKKARKQKSQENKELLTQVQQTEPTELAKQQAIDGEIVSKMGRPSSYTKEIADELLAGLAMGKSLRTVCRDDRMPNISTIFNWFRSHPDFLEQYTRAKAESADMMLEDIMDISDDAQNDYMEVTYGDQSVLRLAPENIARSKLRVETRKWAMSKLQPKKYGDKLDVTSDGKALPTPLLAGLVDPQNTNDDINAQDQV